MAHALIHCIPKSQKDYVKNTQTGAVHRCIFTVKCSNDLSALEKEAEEQEKFDQRETAQQINRQPKEENFVRRYA